MNGREWHHNTIHHHPDKLAIEQSGDHWPCRQERNLPAGHEEITAQINAIRKCRKSPSTAVPAPPWNDLGPSSPEATDCNTWLGRKWNCRPNAIKACVISKTPHAIPPQKMARKALEDVEVESTRSVPFLLRLTRPIDGRGAKSSRVQLRIHHLRLSAKSAAKALSILLQQLLGVLPRCLGQLLAA